METILASHEHFRGFFNGGWAWFWPVAVVLHIAFWALVVWLVLRFARPWLRARQPKGPERTLAERFAEGTISEEDYRQRLDVIRTSQGLR
ncbi:MAG: SHOCT domain-containing protein [Actinomycetota bacterium]